MALLRSQESSRVSLWPEVDNLNAHNVAMAIKKANAALEQLVLAAEKSPKLRHGAENQKVGEIEKAKKIIQALSSASLTFEKSKETLAQAAYVYGQLSEQLDRES